MEDNNSQILREILYELQNQNARTNTGTSQRMSNVYRRFGRGATFSEVFGLAEEHRNVIEEIENLEKKQKELLDDLKNEEEFRKKIRKEVKEQNKNLKDSEKINELINEKLENSKKESEEITSKLKELEDRKYSTNFLNRLVAINSLSRNLVGSLKQIDAEIMNFAKPWAEADKAASKYAKTIGMTATGMKSLRDTTINNVVRSHIGINYNMSTEELLAAQQNYIQSVGRGLRIDNKQQESLAAMSAVMGGEKTNELAVAFENFGVSLNGVADRSGRMFATASKHGLSFEKYSSNVAKNIKIAQNYTFRNGLKGLEGMAQKATALKLDMGQIASFADKVSTIEGSIDVASKLQVLGGSFASIADPLGMLSEGLMDMEGLTDRIIKMVGGLGGFNKTTGEIEVSAFNKQRIKAAAQAMGMDYSQLMESVNASAKREEITRQINMSANAKGLDKDMQELIKNSATFNEKGEAGVSINGEFKTLEKITNADREELIKETQDQSADIKDIAKTLRSLYDIRQGAKKQKEAVQAKNTGWLGNAMSNITDRIGRTNWLLGALVVAQGVSTAINTAGHGLDIFDMFRGGKGGGIRGLFNGGFKNIFKGSVGGVGKGAGILSKIGNVASKIPKAGANLLKTRVGASAGFALAGFGVDALKNHLLKKGKIKEGNFAHGAMTIGADALKFAGIGNMIAPGIGTAIGAAVGATVGAVKMAKLSRQKALDNKLQQKGIERAGEYGAWGLKRINDAMETGNISKRLRRKLERQGDFGILNEIDKKKEQIAQETNVAKGTFTVKNAYFNGKEFVGKTVIKENKESIAKITPIPEIGKTSKITEKTNSLGGMNNTGHGAYDINISGSITLVGSNGKEVDITDELLRNDTFINALASKITGGVIGQKGQNDYGVRRYDVNQMGRMV